MALKLGKMKMRILQVEAKKGKQKDKTLRHQIEEKDYLLGETILISQDVFNLTIAANLTKEVPPVHLIYCIRQCFFVFFMQSLMFFYFCYDFLDFT